MNITLTDEQFNEVKTALIAEVSEKIKNSISCDVSNFTRNFKLCDYEIGEIRNLIKKNISEEVKNRVMNNIKTSKIEEEVLSRVTQRAQNAITQIMKKPVTVNIAAQLTVED